MTILKIASSLLITIMLSEYCFGSECKCVLDGAYVCGKDGFTYSNACKASCYNEKIKHNGRCKISLKGCFCAEEFNEICGVDSITYQNPCLANCNATKMAHIGPCNSEDSDLPPSVNSNLYSKDKNIECNCTTAGPEVCSLDGVTYKNVCTAKCKGAEAAYIGECLVKEKANMSDDSNTICSCLETREPVCGSDGITYTNICFANCNNKTVIHAGECEPNHESGNKSENSSKDISAEKEVFICVDIIENPV